MMDGSRYSCGGSFNILSPGSSSTRLNWLLFWKFDELLKGGLKPPKISTGRQCSMTASLQVLLPTYISLGYPFLREQTQKNSKGTYVCGELPHTRLFKENLTTSSSVSASKWLLHSERGSSPAFSLVKYNVAASCSFFPFVFWKAAGFSKPFFWGVVVVREWFWFCLFVCFFFQGK